jgi:uncharacterized protein
VAWVVVGVIGVGAIVAVYSWFEAGWLRTRVLEVEVPGLPAELDGIRIGHLSDFHLGAPFSRGNAASERAAEWVASRRPDLVCITGDLVSLPRGEVRLRRILGLFERPIVVLGNHDVAVTRDPFSRAAELNDLAGACLLRDEATTVEVRGLPVQVVGSDPEKHGARTATPWTLADPSVAFRILLSHYPTLARRVPPGIFGLTLSGHLHGGQICIPLPGRRPLMLAHLRAEFVSGLYASPAGPLHISPGTGTTLVPFRLFARPEVTELVLVRVRL